jgi:hypothetical protein
MNICDNCRFNKKGYCTVYNSKTVTTQGNTICTKFKKIIPKTTNNIKKKSIKQEKKLAKDLGAKRAPLSGAFATSPEDMRLGNYVIESKATKGKSISVKEEWLSSLRRSPMHFGKIPTLVLEFPGCKRYVVMSEDDFKNIIEEKDE